VRVVFHVVGRDVKGGRRADDSEARDGGQTTKVYGLKKFNDVMAIGIEAAMLVAIVRIVSNH
jgi:hypothetical protein